MNKGHLLFCLLLSIITLIPTSQSLCAKTGGEASSSTRAAEISEALSGTKFFLTSTKEDNGFKVELNVISSTVPQAQLREELFYLWGVKRPGKPIEWTESRQTFIEVPLEYADATVYLQPKDMGWFHGPVYHIKVQDQKVFRAINNVLKVDAEGTIYKMDDTKYSYKYGKVYLEHNTDLPYKYQYAGWSPLQAEVYSPFGYDYTIEVEHGEFCIKHVVPESELDALLKNYKSGQSYVYVVALLNCEQKIIQLVPVTITLK